MLDLQRAAGNRATRTGLAELADEERAAMVAGVLQTPGVPLDAATRAFMEPRFGRDFGGVRVHTDGAAAASAEAEGALAYTVGAHVVFAEGMYAPATRGGQRLLAHELTHVVQQSAAGAPALQRAEAPASQPASAPAADAAIEALDLAPTAKSAAQSLRAKHPEISFTSGRRTVASQASAMAANIVSSKNRSWIADTYASAAALQKWVDDHPEATTQAALAAGLEATMDAMSDADRAKVSKHLTGEAFDVQPQEADAATIKADIKALAGLTKFLDKEGGLTRWHAQFKRAEPGASAGDPLEVEAERVAAEIVDGALSTSASGGDGQGDLGGIQCFDDAEAAEMLRAQSEYERLLVGPASPSPLADLLAPFGNPFEDLAYGADLGPDVDRIVAPSQAPVAEPTFELRPLGGGAVAVVQRVSRLALDMPDVLNASATEPLGDTIRNFRGAAGERAAELSWGTSNLNQQRANFGTVDIRARSLLGDTQYASVASSADQGYLREKFRRLFGERVNVRKQGLTPAQRLFREEELLRPFERAARDLHPGLSQAEANAMLRTRGRLWVPSDVVGTARNAVRSAISSNPASYRAFIEHELGRAPVIQGTTTVSSWAALQALPAADQAAVVDAVAGRSAGVIQPLRITSTQTTRLIAWRAALPTTWTQTWGTSIFRGVEARSGGFLPFLNSLHRPSSMTLWQRAYSPFRDVYRVGVEAWRAGGASAGGRLVAARSRDAVLRSLARGEIARQAQVQLAGGLGKATLGAVRRAGTAGAVVGVVLESGIVLWDVANDRPVSGADATARIGAGAIGVAGSAVAGAAIGSVVPVAGTAVGAVVGVVVGVIYDVAMRPAVEEKIRDAYDALSREPGR